MEFIGMPPHMGEGSEGDYVDILLHLLDAAATKDVAGPTGIVLDGVLGPVAMGVLCARRVEVGLPAEGGFDTEARTAFIKQFGPCWDLLLHRHRVVGGRNQRPGVTGFVQKDCSVLYWAADVVATRDKAFAVAAFEERHLIQV